MRNSEAAINEWGYEPFEAWMDRFVDDGKDNWGTGNCWEYFETGGDDCGVACGGHHPRLRLTSIGAGNAGTRSDILEGNMVPAWARAHTRSFP